MRARATLTALASLGNLAGCGGGASPAPAFVAITTEQQPANICMEALISGVLVPHAAWGLALQVPGTGELMRPMFPFGYRAVLDGDSIVLLDEDGRLVARTGDFIQSSGGSIGREGNPVVVLCDNTIEVVGAGA